MRLVVPLAIFKFPLAGILLSMGADYMDVEIMSRTGFGFFSGRYQEIDKGLDIYYLSLAFLSSRNWKDVLARRTSGILFWARALGTAIFEFSGLRIFIILLPNIFEPFFVFRLIALKFKPGFRVSPKVLVFSLLILGIPKTIQEFLMHYMYPDKGFSFILRDLFQKLF